MLTHSHKIRLSFLVTFLSFFLFTVLFSPLLVFAAGWSLDQQTGVWTYVELYSDGPGYSLKKGWHDDVDGYRYYLHDETGHMLTGYHVIGDKLCYFKEEPNQGNYRQHEDMFWYYYENGNVPYGALIAMCDLPGDGSPVGSGADGPGFAIEETGTSSGSDGEETSIASKTDDASVSIDDHTDTDDATVNDTTAIENRDIETDDETDDDSDHETTSDIPKDENNKDDGEDDAYDDSGEDNPGADDDDDSANDDTGGSGAEDVTHEGPCVAHDSIAAIRETLETDPAAYDACIENFCRKGFRLRSNGIDFSLDGEDPPETAITDMLLAFSEGETIDISAVLYGTDGDELRFMSIDTPEELVLPMHAGVHPVKDGKNRFYGESDDLPDGTEAFTNHGGVVNTLPFGLLNESHLTYQYLDEDAGTDDEASDGEDTDDGNNREMTDDETGDDEASDGETDDSEVTGDDVDGAVLRFDMYGCDLYEVLRDSDGNEVKTRRVELLEKRLKYDSFYPQRKNQPEKAYTRFFFPSAEEVGADLDSEPQDADGSTEDVSAFEDADGSTEEASDVDERLRAAILEGEACWLRSLSAMPEDEAEVDVWKHMFLSQDGGAVSETYMKDAMPTRFYFTVE